METLRQATATFTVRRQDTAAKEDAIQTEAPKKYTLRERPSRTVWYSGRVVSRLTIQEPANHQSLFGKEGTRTHRNHPRPVRPDGRPPIRLCGPFLPPLHVRPLPLRQREEDRLVLLEPTPLYAADRPPLIIVETDGDVRDGERGTVDVKTGRPSHPNKTSKT